MFWLLLTLQSLSGLIAAEAALRKYPEGRDALNKLSRSGLFFLRWRAHAGYKNDLINLRTIFGITALVFSFLLLIIGPTQSPSLLNVAPGFFIVLWITLQFGTNFSKSVQEQFFIAGLLAIGPWLSWGVDYIASPHTDSLRLIAQPFNEFGIQELPDFQIACILSFLGLVSGILISIFSIVMFSIVPLFFLFLLVLLSIASKSALKLGPKKAYYLAIFYCYGLGPALVAMESKGII